jgi:hypothetical protein
LRRNNLMRRGLRCALAAALAGSFVMLVGATPAIGAGGDSITQPGPVAIAPGGSVTLPDQTLHLDAAPPKADILLAFDTTGSMGQAIADARNDAASIVNTIKASIPGARFALANFRDYPFSPFGSGGEGSQDYPWQMNLDFTADLPALQSALAGIAACSGCGADLPEAYNRAFYEAYHEPGLHWDPASPRFMIVLGDSYGHDPSQAVDFGSTNGSPNCPATSPRDPGPDATVNTADDLGTLPTLTTLKGTYHTNVSFVTYNPGSGPPNNVGCQLTLARFTGGNAVVHSAGTTGLGDQIVALINQAAAKVDTVNFDISQTSGPETNASSWFSFFPPPPLGPAVAPVDIRFQETVSAPEGAALGTYVFKVTAVADGSPRAVQTVTVNVVSDAVSNVHLSVDEASLPAGIANARFADIPASRIPYFAGSTTASTPFGATPYGATPFGATPFGATPYGATPWGATPFGATPYGATPYGATPFGATPWGATPFGATPFGATGVLGDTPFGATPFGATPFQHVLLSQLPLVDPTDNATWPLVLAGTPMAGQPLNAVTLADVLANDTTRGRLYALPLRDVSFASTLWQGVPISAILLGTEKVSQVPALGETGPANRLASWQSEIASKGGCASCIQADNTFFGISIAGALGNANLGSIPFGATPYGATVGGAIKLTSMNIAGTRLAPVPLSLSALSNLATIVDCSFGCSGKTLGDAAAANALKPAATLANLFDGLATSTNPDAVRARGITLDEIVAAILPLSAFPDVPLQGLQDKVGTGKNAHYHVDFDLACGSTSSFKVSVRLPFGFYPVAGSSKFTYGSAAPVAAQDPTLTTGKDGTTTAAWTTPAGACPSTDTQQVGVDFASFVGLRLGDQPSTASVVALGVTHNAPEHAPVLVTENQEPNDDPATAPVVDANQFIVGHVAHTGDAEYYRFSLAGVPVNSRLVVSLDNPRATDLDLTLNGPSLGAIQSNPFGATALGSTPVPDQPVAADNSQTVPQTNTLSDVPFGATPWGATPFGATAAGSISQNRGDESESATMVVHASSNGMATIGVTGYNGAWSNDPYVLRLQLLPAPPLPNCPARTGFDNAAEIGPLAAPSSLPQTTKTLFLVDRQRLARLYGSSEADKLVAKASAGGALGADVALVAQRPEVAGAVLSVDGNANVRSAYAAWDANPCSPDAANGVVRSINDLVANYRAALPNLKYIVLLGTDTAVPLWRQPDPTTLSPELDEAPDLAFTTSNLTAGNSLYASAAQNNILTDGAYGAFTRITWLDHDLPLPQVSVSRLVETPSDILAQFTQYRLQNWGTITPQRALTTGYDFLADGADATNAAFGDTARLPGLVTDSLISHPGPAPAHTPGAPVWTKDDILGTPTNPGSFFGRTPIPDIGALYAHYNHYAMQPVGPSPITDISQVPTTQNVMGKNLAGHIIITVGCHGGLNAGDELGAATAPADLKPLYQDWAQTYAQDKAAVYIANTGFGYGDTETVAASEKLMKLFAENMNKGSSNLGDNWLDALHKYFLGSAVYDAYDEKVMLEATFYGLPFYHFGTPPTAADTSTMTASPSGAIDIGSTSISPSLTPKTGEGGTQFWEGPAGTLAVPYRSIQPVATKDVTINGKQARDVFLTALTTHDVGGVKPAQAYPVADNSNERGSRFGDAFWPASFATVLRAPRFGSGERDVVSVNAGQFRPGSGATGTERLVDSIGFDVTYSTAADTTEPLISQVGAIQDQGASTAQVFVRATDNSGSIRKVAVLWNDGRQQWGYFDNFTQLPNGLYVGTITGLIGHVEVGAEVMDFGGNVAQSWDKAFNFQAVTSADVGPPAIVVDNPLPTQVYTLNQQVTPSFTCSPDGGAIASCTASPLLANGRLDTTTVGTHTLTITATPLGGTPVTRTVTYAVYYGFDGFRQPVDNPPVLNTAQAGKTIPVKWALLDAAGNSVSQLSAVTSVSVAMLQCPSEATDAIETTVADGLAGLTYDTAGKQFIFNWQTTKGWTGCRRLIVQLADGSPPRYADFKFK